MPFASKRIPGTFGTVSITGGSSRASARGVAAPSAMSATAITASGARERLPDVTRAISPTAIIAAAP
jgi:hypothetical protein